MVNENELGLDENNICDVAIIILSNDCVSNKIMIWNKLLQLMINEQVMRSSVQ